MAEALLIDKVSDGSDPPRKPLGWHHRRDHPSMSYQVGRALGEASEGGDTVSECFRAEAQGSANACQSMTWLGPKAVPSTPMRALLFHRPARHHPLNDEDDFLFAAAGRAGRWPN